ncbi:hypothetical protein D9M71_788140 [compost metagenome]
MLRSVDPGQMENEIHSRNQSAKLRDIVSPTKRQNLDIASLSEMGNQVFPHEPICAGDQNFHALFLWNSVFTTLNCEHEIQFKKQLSHSFDVQALSIVRIVILHGGDFFFAKFDKFTVVEIA